MTLQKIISILATALLMTALCTGTVTAEKHDWRDNNYNFKSVQTAWIEDIDLSGVTLDSDITQKCLLEYYQKQETRPKWQVLTKDQINRKISLLEWQDLDTLATTDPDKAKTLWDQDLPKIANVHVTAKLTRYDQTSKIIPAHTEWETRETYDTYRDKDGHTYTVTHYYQVPVYVPEHTVWISHVIVRYDIQDTATGKTIFSREDIRDDTDSLQNVYELSVRSFFRELKLE